MKITSPKNPDLSDVRGMSDPFFFSFDTEKSGTVLCHGVIFSSFEIAGNNTDLRICSLDSDPRMRAFVSFVRSNWGTEALVKASIDLENRVSFLTKRAANLEAKISSLRQQLNNINHTHNQ